LRQAGIEQQILVLGGFIHSRELQTCIDFSLDPVLHHQMHLDCLQQNPNLNGLSVWVKIDSGMGRLGFSLNRTLDVTEYLTGLDTLGNVRLMTHLASADDIDNHFTTEQIERVQSLGLDDYEWGIANSAGTLGWPTSHRVWVRAGIALYGADPLSDRNSAKRQLIPAMTMKSIVLAVNDHHQGDMIGYANTFTCPGDMTIAVVATGYADGYPRHKIDTAQVLIHDRLCDLVGRVSMDMITVDVSHLDRVEIGDEVILFGQTPNVSELADCSQTIAYEILCNVGAHVKREYSNSLAK
jgi:alanine racemase